MPQAQPQISELHLAADPGAWAAMGFTVNDDAVRLGSVRLRLDPSLEPSPAGGASAWTLTGVSSDMANFDGLPHADPGPTVNDAMQPAESDHPNSAVAIDHLVVFSPDLERTIAAFESVGVRCRRIREVGPAEAQLRQAFFRFAEVIVEVVQVPEAKAGPNGAATFWGLTLVVADLDDAAQMLGENLGEARDAVQPGRRIATFRKAAGLGLPVALITPQPPRD